MRLDLQDHVGRVNRVVDYARDHVTSDLTLRTLAKVGAYSPYHFHRVFKAVTGETPGAFTRRARLERAGGLMQAAPHRDLTHLALDLGYSSLSEFSRSFRREYGRPPSAWDRHSHLNGRPPRPAAPRDSSSDSLAVTIVDRPMRRIAYVRTRYFEPGARWAGLQRLTQWLESQGVDWRESAMTGFCCDHYELTPWAKIRYDFGFDVPDRVQGEGEFCIRELPAMRCAEIAAHGTQEDIVDAWDHLYERWFPQSHFEPACVPEMKRFRKRPDEIGWERWDIVCSVAIQPRLP